MIQTPVRQDSKCEPWCRMVSRRPLVFHRETNKLMLLGLAVHPTWRLVRSCLSSIQPTPTTPDNTGGGGPGNNTGRVNSPKKDPRGAANSKLRGSKRLPGEASNSLHAGKLEQWLCGDPLTGDHFHCVVVITNGKFVSVRMPRQTSGAIKCGSWYKKVL